MFAGIGTSMSGVGGGGGGGTGTGTSSGARAAPSYRSPLEEDLLNKLDADLILLRQIAGHEVGMRLDTSEGNLIKPYSTAQHSFQLAALYHRGVRWWTGDGRKRCAEVLTQFYARFDADARLILVQSESILHKQGQFSISMIDRMLEFACQLCDSTKGLRNIIETYDREPNNDHHTYAKSRINHIIQTVIPTTVKELKRFFDDNGIDTAQFDEFVSNNHFYSISHAPAPASSSAHPRVAATAAATAASMPTPQVLSPTPSTAAAWTAGGSGGVTSVNAASRPKSRFDT
jgi:hypothetical protein